jgi:hypothetical protein
LVLISKAVNNDIYMVVSHNLKYECNVIQYSIYIYTQTHTDTCTHIHTHTYTLTHTHTFIYKCKQTGRVKGGSPNI